MQSTLTREIVLLYRKDKFINFAAKAFIRLLVEKLDLAQLSDKSRQLIRSLVTSQ